jgi:uncharacterized protein with von Willebrand factor type A (vWA) domain
MKTYVDHNALDELRLDELIGSSKLLVQYTNEGQHHFEDFNNLLKDIIFLLYKHAPMIEKPLPMTVHYELLTHLYALKEFSKLRLRTVGSLSNTYLSLKLILDGLFESVRGRHILNDLKKLIDEQTKKELEMKLSTITLQDIDDLLSQHEKEKLQVLLDEINQSYMSDYTMQDFLLSLLKQMNQSKVEDQLDELIKETLLENKPTSFEDLIDQMEVNESDDERTSFDEIEEIIDHGLEEDLEKRFIPYLKDQYLSQGQHLEQGQYTFDLSSDTKEEQIHFSDNPVTSSDSPVDTEAYELTEDMDNLLRGSARPNKISKEPPLLQQSYVSKKKSLLKQLKLSRVIAKSKERLDDFNQTTKTLGIDSESVNLLSFDDVINLYRRYKKPAFVRFINKVGKNKKFAGMMQYKKRKKHVIPIDKVTSSNKIDLLIDEELTRLALDIEAFDNDFYDRYLNDNLLTLDMIAKNDKHKGPIILCYDGSGSMEGIKIEETQSHILGVMEIAKLQKRHMVIIQFASKSEPLYIKEINPKYMTAKDITDILDTFICGGTNFEKPLKKATEFIIKDRHNKSDILFITDGQCEIPEKFKIEFLQLKKRRDFKLYTLIMHSYTYHDYGDIGDISDEIMEIQEKDFNNWNTSTNEKLYSLI